MKTVLKFTVSFVFVAALVFGLMTVGADNAEANSPCPPTHCPQVLDGYTYLGTCSSDVPGQTCLGWIYRKGSETCHVAALSGI